MTPYSFLQPPERTDKEVAQCMAWERRERQRLAWLQCFCAAGSTGDMPYAHTAAVHADAMMREYNERWESDEESS